MGFFEDIAKKAEKVTSKAGKVVSDAGKTIGKEAKKIGNNLKKVVIKTSLDILSIDLGSNWSEQSSPCGPASLTNYLQLYYPQDSIVPEYFSSKVSNILGFRIGIFPSNMALALEEYLRKKNDSANVKNISCQESEAIKYLKYLLNKKKPVLVLLTATGDKTAVKGV